MKGIGPMSNHVYQKDNNGKPIARRAAKMLSREERRQVARDAFDDATQYKDQQETASIHNRIFNYVFDKLDRRRMVKESTQAALGFHGQPGSACFTRRPDGTIIKIVRER